MPLHLLGKKSWNVYNKDNIERVRRDEAAAAAREEAEEQRMQETDAARRTAILRGEQPPALEEATEESSKPARTRDDATGRERKRRRVRGEDDTDRDIRYAREDAELGEKTRSALTRHSMSDAPLHDHAGHINLFPAPDEREIRKSQKNAEAEAEKAKKQRQLEDQYTMRFSNAAGFKQGLEKPWYAAQTKVGTEVGPLQQEDGKDVWGNADPRRHEREKARTSMNDPFAFMQKAQTQLKQAEKDKERWKREREREIEDLKAEDERRRKERRHRRHRAGSENSLEGFELDAPSSRHDAEGRRRHRSQSSRHGRHRSRSRGGRRHSEHHGHRKRSRSP